MLMPQAHSASPSASPVPTLCRSAFPPSTHRQFRRRRPRDRCRGRSRSCGAWPSRPPGCVAARRLRGRRLRYFRCRGSLGRLNTPRGRSVASISLPGSIPGRSARTVTTFRSTSRSNESALIPGRSNSTKNSSPSRQASIGITAGRAAVPITCWARRSRSRKGSVRISMVATSNSPIYFLVSTNLCHMARVLYSTSQIFGQATKQDFLLYLRRGAG